MEHPCHSSARLQRCLLLCAQCKDLGKDNNQPGRSHGLGWVATVQWVEMGPRRESSTLFSCAHWEHQGQTYMSCCPCSVTAQESSVPQICHDICFPIKAPHFSSQASWENKMQLEQKEIPCPSPRGIQQQQLHPTLPKWVLQQYGDIGALETGFPHFAGARETV